jgi:hypothetical protein
MNTHSFGGQQPTLSGLTDLCLQQVTDRKESHLWNEYIDSYHYLGYHPLPGAQLRYFVRDGDRILALLGFGAAAWKTAPLDRFIGWISGQRKCKLHLITRLDALRNWGFPRLKQVVISVCLLLQLPTPFIV